MAADAVASAHLSAVNVIPQVSSKTSAVQVSGAHDPRSHSPPSPLAWAAPY